jgi:hypothetical protein
MLALVSAFDQHVVDDAASGRSLFFHGYERNTVLRSFEEPKHVPNGEEAEAQKAHRTRK